MIGAENAARLETIATHIAKSTNDDDDSLPVDSNVDSKPIAKARQNISKKTRRRQPRARKSIATLRRTQSESIPNKTHSDKNSDSDSDSDLPDAQSLLMTPELKKKFPAKRKKTFTGATMIEPPTLAATQIKPALLVKSASEELQIAKEDDADDLGCIQTLRVPGELVLAVFRREYYPARIIAKISENRYKVEFFDGFKNILSRSSMFTMYDKKFKTCRLGRFQLVGDEPAIRRTSLGTIDLETDFSRDMVIFRDLVKQVEAVRKHLDRLHQCSADELEKMAETEYRIKTFFSGDASSKRLLASQVSSGFLNRAEFDFLGRLLSRWYRDPPSAASAADAQHQISQTRETEQKIEQSGLSTTDPSSPKSVLTEDTDATEILPEAVESNERLCSHNTSKTGTEQESEPASKNTHCALDLDQHEKSSLALRFVYDVLVPHAIRRMTVNREACSLEESEQLMRSKNRENQWVEHILAARGISLETWI